MNITDIKKNIIKGLREHFRMQEGYVWWPEWYEEQDDFYASDAFYVQFVEAGQVALQVLGAFEASLSYDDPDGYVPNEERARETRAFLVECGFPESFAQRFISDRDPDGIY